MKSIAVKVLIGALGAGTIATGVAFSNLSDNYESYLRKQGRELLTSNSNKWDTLKTKYSEEGDELLITIDNKQVQKANLQTQQLKEWCLVNNKGTFTNTKDEIYQRVSAWCTNPKTIFEKIKSSKKILNTTEPVASSGAGNTQTPNPDESLWTRKVQSYNSLTDSTKLIKKIVGNTEGTETVNAGAANATILRSWCNFSKDKHYKHEEDNRYNSYLSWCTE